MGKVIFQVRVPSKPWVSRAVSVRKNSPLQLAGLRPSTQWSHMHKVPLWQDSLVGDWKPGSSYPNPAKLLKK